MVSRVETWKRAWEDEQSRGSRDHGTIWMRVMLDSEADTPEG